MQAARVDGITPKCKFIEDLKCNKSGKVRRELPNHEPNFNREPGERMKGRTNDFQGFLLLSLDLTRELLHLTRELLILADQLLDLV